MENEQKVNVSADVSWLDRDIQRYRKTGTLIPKNQWRIYNSIKDHWVVGRTVVDIGCSLGFGSNILSHTARHVWGIDINEESLHFAKTMFARPNLSFEHVDIENPPARPLANFEIAVMSEVIEHLADTETGINTFKSFFSPKLNTIGFITVPNINHPKVGPADARNELHINRWTPGEFYALLTEHFRHVTLYNGNRLRTWGQEETIDGNDTAARIVVAKVEGVIVEE